MTVTRRGFLRGSTSVLACAAVPRLALADGGLTNRTVPGTTTRFKILEIFFAGALSHRETLWVERPDEAPSLRRISALAGSSSGILAPVGAPGAWTSWLTAAGTYEGSSYQMRGGSSAVHLGPCGEPLVRPNSSGARLKDRLRVFATGHELGVHEEAQRLMMQGLPARTSPSRAFGVGSAISRHTGKPSFVFYDASLGDSTHAASCAAPVGRHGSEFAPLLVPYDNPEIVSLLGAPRNAARDTLSGYYNDHYEAGLTFRDPASPASGLRARSVSLDRYLDAISAAWNGPALAATLGMLSSSGGRTLWDNGARRAIQTSVQLLASDFSSYCCVSDGGVVGAPSGFSLYDSHGVESFDDHAAYTTGNVLSVLRTLREEIDAGRLNLSNTLVVLNTEFGRSFKEASGSHHAWGGFAVAALGGPIPSGAGGVVGDLAFVSTDDANPYEDENPAYAEGGLSGGGVSPTDLRAAVLLAAGIHPFQVDTFDMAESSASGEPSREAAADRIAQQLFGL